MGLTSEGPLDPILAAMRAAGYFKITEPKKTLTMGDLLSNPNDVFADVIAPTEEAKGSGGTQRQGSVLARRRSRTSVSGQSRVRLQSSKSSTLGI
jgi:hypothetical protein